MEPEGDKCSVAVRGCVAVRAGTLRLNSTEKAPRWLRGTDRAKAIS